MRAGTKATFLFCGLVLAACGASPLVKGPADAGNPPDTEATPAEKPTHKSRYIPWAELLRKQC